MRVVIGIDPGKHGAVCLLTNDAIQFWDAPLLPATKKRKAQYDVPAMVAFLREAIRLARSSSTDEVPLVAIESQQAMPGQGVSTTFVTGVGFGLWFGIAHSLGALLGADVATVWPRAWKDAVLPAGRQHDKAAAECAAVRLRPGVGPLLRTPRGRLIDGRSDAACIAAWARATHAR